MRIRLAVPNDVVGPGVLNAALEATTRTDQKLLENGTVPSARKAIAAGRVRWRPEPPGDEHFDIASKVLRRGWGDCDDLAPWHAASLRTSGADPDARAVVYKSGPSKWHAVVKRGDGSIDDPSRWAGMGKNVVGLAPSHVPLVRSMPGNHRLLRMCTGPWGRRGHFARVDLPWANNPGFALSGAAYTKCSPRDALCRAIMGATIVGEASGAVKRRDLLRAAAMHDLLKGCSVDHVIKCVGEEDADHLIGFLPALTAAIPIATHFGKKILKRRKGKRGRGRGGRRAPAPPPAGGGGGGRGSGYGPNGPIFVRF